MHTPNTHLDLSRQGLQLLPVLSPHLLSVDASHNNICSVSRLPAALRNLVLAHNKLAFPGNLENLAPDLDHLDLSHNRLISLEGLGTLCSLETLQISNNYVGDDQLELLRDLRTLKFLDISHNHLSDSCEFLSSLPNLREFVNTSNDLFFMSVTASLKHLQKLVLDSNKLSLLEFKAELPALRVLSVKENSLTSIEGVHHLKNLEELLLDSNAFAAAGTDWALLAKLKRLSLKRNQLESDQHLPQQVKTLDLSYNKLAALTAFPALVELNVSHNTLAHLPELPQSLDTLIVSHNQLTSLAGLPNSLVTLAASHNEFPSLPPEIEALPFLEKLELDGVPLTTVEQNRLSSLLTLVNSQSLNKQDSAESLKQSPQLSEREVSPSLTPDLASYMQSSPSTRNAWNHDSPSIFATRESPIVSVKRESPMVSASRESPVVSAKHISPLVPTKRQSPLVSAVRESSQPQLRFSPIGLSPQLSVQSSVAPPRLSAFSPARRPPLGGRPNLGGNDSLSVSEIGSIRELQSTHQSNPKLDTLTNFQEVFDQKERELSSRIERLEQETKNMFHLPTTQTSERKAMHKYAPMEIDPALVAESPKQEFSQLDLSNIQPDLSNVQPGLSNVQSEKQEVVRPPRPPSRHETSVTSSRVTQLSQASRGSRPPRKHSCCCRRRRRSSRRSHLSSKKDQSTSPRQSLSSSRYEQVSQPSVIEASSRRESSRTLQALSSNQEPLRNERSSSNKPSSRRFEVSPRDLPEAFDDDREVKTVKKALGNAAKGVTRFNKSELVLFAFTPARPVFPKEAFTPITTQLLTSSSEFKALAQFFAQQGRTLVAATKTYTHSLAVQFKQAQLESTDGDKENLDLLFFVGTPKESHIASTSPNGFKELGTPVQFSRMCRDSASDCTMKLDCALVAIVSGFIDAPVTNLASAFPAYFAEFK